MKRSTKPYLLRALYEWCTDNNYTPYLSSKIDNSTRVPQQFLHDGEIVLNIGLNATSQLKIGNEWIEFITRFSGRAYKIEIPVSNVLAIYARENRHGMEFDIRNESNPSLSENNQEFISNIEEKGDGGYTSQKLNYDAEGILIKPSRTHLKLVK